MLSTKGYIRLSVDFWEHPRVVTLEHWLGLKGVKALMLLWAWAAKNRPDGDLSGMSEEDIEFVAQWSRHRKKRLVPVLVALQWLVETETGYALHRRNAN